MKSVQRFLSPFSILLGFLLLTSLTNLGGEGVSMILGIAKYKAENFREVVFVLPENGCSNSTREVIQFVNDLQNVNETTVLIIAESIKNVKYGDRFKSLRIPNPLFVETSVAQRRGVFVDSPIFALIENSNVVDEIAVNCETLGNAKEKVAQFLKRPYSYSYCEGLGN